MEMFSLFLRSNIAIHKGQNQAKSLLPDKLNSVLFWQKIENPHWGKTGRNSQFSIVNIQLKTVMIKTLNLKLTF